MSFSLTLTALAVLLIKYLMDAAGVVVPESDIEKFVSVLVDIACGLGIYIGRVRKGDLTWWGQRK